MKHRHLCLIAFLIFAGGAGGGRLAAPTPADAAPDAAVATAAVTIDGLTLFPVRGVSSFPAEARAAGIRERIIATAADPGVDPASIRVVEGDAALRIM